MVWYIEGHRLRYYFIKSKAPHTYNFGSAVSILLYKTGDLIPETHAHTIIENILAQHGYSICTESPDAQFDSQLQVEVDRAIGIIRIELPSIVL